MNIIINENNLNDNEINEFNTKVRALLIDGDNILVANYGSVMLLPGGSVDRGESIDHALIRELSEEIGISYQQTDFDFLATISFYQKDYPKRDGSSANRLVQTHYFVGPYHGVKKQDLTEKEIKDNFQLSLLPLDDLENQIRSNHSQNPRNSFFQQELLKILEIYKRKVTKSQKAKRISKHS